MNNLIVAAIYTKDSASIALSLTQGNITWIDAADLAAVSKHSWCIQNAKHTKYARRGSRINGKGFVQTLHQFLTGYKRTDHIDREGLNNRRNNLRPATVQQNACNKIKTPGVSQYKGVYLSRKMWRAMIRIDKKKVHIGNFTTEIEAAKAYDAMAIKIQGEFARPNFPQETL